MVERLGHQLLITTRHIGGLPYKPQAWAERSEHLLALGFPELGAADAYKAIVLCNLGLDHKEQSIVGEQVRLIVGLQLSCFNNTRLVEISAKDVLKDAVVTELRGLRLKG